MGHKHEAEIPLALESVASRLDELQSVFGSHTAPALAAVRTALIAAMAARDRGDMPGAVQRIGEAMDRLAALAGECDAGEAALMRAVADRFRGALLRGDPAQAAQTAAVMFGKSGAVERKRS